MCSKPPKPKKVEEKPVQYLRNPFLDAINIGTNTGRNSLRIDLDSGRSSPIPFEGDRTPTSPVNPKGAALRNVGNYFNPGLLFPSRNKGGAPRFSF